MHVKRIQFPASTSLHLIYPANTGSSNSYYHAVFKLDAVHRIQIQVTPCASNKLTTVVFDVLPIFVWKSDHETTAFSMPTVSLVRQKVESVEVRC